MSVTLSEALKRVVELTQQRDESREAARWLSYRLTLSGGYLAASREAERRWPWLAESEPKPETKGPNP